MQNDNITPVRTDEHNLKKSWKDIIGKTNKNI